MLQGKKLKNKKTIDKQEKQQRDVWRKEGIRKKKEESW